MQGVIFAKRFNWSTRYSLIISFCVVMAFCSFSSLVGEMCGPSPENPNVVRLLDLKNCAHDVKAHLKFCNILTNVESVNSERKLLRGGHWGLRYCGIGQFFMRYFGNFNFKLRYCGILRICGMRYFWRFGQRYLIQKKLFYMVSDPFLV